MGKASVSAIPWLKARYAKDPGLKKRVEKLIKKMDAKEKRARG